VEFVRDPFIERGSTMLASIGVMRALHRHDVREFKDRRKRIGGKRKLTRDE
jgi:hypothetical protein